jgi:hypothetical protein
MTIPQYPKTNSYTKQISTCTQSPRHKTPAILYLYRLLKNEGRVHIKIREIFSVFSRLATSIKVHLNLAVLRRGKVGVSEECMMFFCLFRREVNFATYVRKFPFFVSFC